MAGKSDNLTDPQERYVQELLIGKSQREAYRLAYPKSVKWKDSAVDSNASTLLANTKVQQRFSELKAVIAKKAEAKYMVTAERITEELARIAFSDIKDFLTFRTGKTVVGYDDDGEPIIDYAKIIDVMDSESVDGKVIQEISVDAKGTFKFKLHSKLDAIEKLNKMMGAYVEKKEEKIDQTITVNFNIPRPE